MALMNFMRNRAAGKQARLPPKCADCGTAWLYNRQARLGVCTSCMKKREILRKIVIGLRSSEPSARVRWTIDGQALRITWGKDIHHIPEDITLTLGKEELLAFPDGLSFRVRALRNALFSRAREREDATTE